MYPLPPPGDRRVTHERETQSAEPGKKCVAQNTGGASSSSVTKWGIAAIYGPRMRSYRTTTTAMVGYAVLAPSPEPPGRCSGTTNHVFIGVFVLR